MKQVINRNGQIIPFNFSKIEHAVRAAMQSVSKGYTDEEKVTQTVLRVIKNTTDMKEEATIDEIQKIVEDSLMCCGQYDAARSYIEYRKDHKDSRFIADRIDYMNRYALSNSNAATSSETDANANVTMKNVANLEGEVYKTTNRIIQRQRMKDMLNKLYPEVAKQYEKDLDHHIIYIHDEASSPTLKYYCQAVSLYPLMCDGVGKIDGVTPGPPNDLQSFSGQLTNLAFLLSAQCKGAVAFGEALVAMSWYVEKEYGDKWWEHLDEPVSTNLCKKVKTIRSEIKKALKQVIYGVNQPAGNRSYNSPFTNFSIYDKTYFNALFDDFRFPDGTSAKWEAVDCIQRIFMQLRRELNLIKPLTFPVTTIALVNNGTDIIDKEYKEFCAEEWAKGSSHFCYNSDNPTSLASCCRVLNEITENTFSSINGLQGIMTGSCNVITLNFNRIIQDWYKSIDSSVPFNFETHKDSFRKYLTDILERVYKYHIAFKTMLYESEDRGMFASCNGDYIYMKKLYSTIGLIGYQEAAMFLGIKISKNKEYIDFLNFILGIIKEENKKHSINDKKRPFKFNSEAIPGENLAVKCYEWDKSDGYFVPEDRNLYASYFYNPWDHTSIIDKLYLHGGEISKSTDGGQAAHINLDQHLTKEHYLKLIDYSTNNRVNYFTFNIPISECKDCGHVVSAPIKECPKCNSKNIDYWTRIIGYLRPVSAFSESRQIEEKRRVYSDGIEKAAD